MRRRKSASSYAYTDGIVHGWVGQIEAPDAPLLNAATATITPNYGIAAYRGKTLLQVTNNGKVWSYALRPMLTPSPGGNGYAVKFAHNFLPERCKYFSAPPLARLESAYRAPLEWARRDMAKRAKLAGDTPGALLFDCAYDIEAQPDATIKLVGPCGPITYTGITRKIGSYTLEQLHEIVAKSVADCAGIWTWRSAGMPPWKPSGLEVMLHTGKQALGLAFAPGTGRDTNKRVISLNKVLLEQYDAHSIWRVTVHELCHHYRDEVFARGEVDPAERDTLLQTVKAYIADKGFRAASQWSKILGTHDATFVRELGRVDPKIKENLITGMVFTEYADQSLVAEVTAKREARKAAAASKIVWSVADGRLYLDYVRSARHVSVWWMPLIAGRWKPARETMSNGQMRALMQRLGPEWAKTAVTYSDSWPSYWTRPDTLGAAVPYLEHNLGLFLGEFKPT